MTNAVLEAARRLGSSISARSAEIEALGTLPIDLVDDIRPSGAFRLCVPDASVAAQHAMVSPRTMETAGRMRLGLGTNTATL